MSNPIRQILEDHHLNVTERLTAKAEIALEALIEERVRQARIKDYETMIKMIDDYKPDPAAPSFGSASGAMETQGWRNYFTDRLDTLRSQE